jgi:Angiotensin-converting enzyme.
MWKNGEQESPMEKRRNKLESIWWRIREYNQGMSTSIERTEEYGDRGAKYYMPGNTPYIENNRARKCSIKSMKAQCNEMEWGR